MNKAPNPKRTLLTPVSPAAEGPLYQQVIDSIKRALAEGRLAPGASLPSFRALAADLNVSLITVKRAYEELERERIIYRKQGLGTFVSSNGVARSREIKRRQAEALLRDALRECEEAGMSPEELLPAVERHLKGRRD